jgi:MoaA/NifB/PqqE/SkfB family radical SAM enzyme
MGSTTSYRKQLLLTSRGLRQFSVEQVIGLGLRILSSASDENLVRLAGVLEKIARSRTKKETIGAIKEAFKNNHPSIVLAKRLLKDLNPRCKKSIISYVVNAIYADSTTRKQYQEQYGCPPPIVVLVSPTMRCNLRCIGCYANNYHRQEELEPQLLHRIINECREIGVHLITILGGEPFIYQSLLDVLAQHRDMVFQVFTNGTLIDRELASRIVQVGNIAPVISIEGFQRETDARRGTGTFNKIMEAMDYLRQSGGLFFYSVTSTRNNWQAVVSDEFVDLMIDKGAALGWYFNYMPVGHQPDINLMPTPEQRNYIRDRVNKLRRRKPILLVDFWGDGPLVDGCLAGGKLYLHINSQGKVEPCIFAHFSVDNIKEKSLAEVLNSEFFRGIRKMQPFGPNDIRPCPLIDHPGAMAYAVRKYGAAPTHEEASKIISDFVPELQQYSKRVAEIYKPIWENEYKWAHNNSACQSSGKKA